MPGIAVGVGASVLGSVASSAISGAMSGGASKGAAGQQIAAADAATNLQRDVYNQTTQNLAPWLTRGNTAGDMLQNFMGLNPSGGWGGVGSPDSPLTNHPTYDSFMASPWFQAMQAGQRQGTDAIINRSTVGGGPFSGNTLRALSDYGQGSALQGYGAYSNDFQNQQQTLFSRLFGLSGAGQNAAVQQGGFGQNFANQAGSNMIGAGNAAAAGTIGANNAWGSAIGNLGNSGIMSALGGGSGIGNGISNWMSGANWNGMKPDQGNFYMPGADGAMPSVPM